TDRRGPQAFGYDQLDRLTSASHPLLATPQAFAYDPVGNRTTGGSTHNAANQLTADATHSYQYDDNGNLTRKTLLATGNFTQYTYDAENRLTKVEEFAAGNPTPTATSTYRYDGLGRRIEKVANGQTKRYVYDRADILLEYDGSNALLARYTHGSRIDEPIAITKGSSTFFYHQDGLGTVTELTDSSGTIAKSYAYDAYGNIVDQTGNLDQPYTYTGREFDAETGLYYYRARYYEPSSGRFLQHDPLRFFGGDLNLYGYVLNNPNNLVDPWGLWWTSGHKSLTINAASSRCFSSTDVDLMVDANLHVDRLSNQLNNPDHYMPGTEEEAGGRVRMWMDLAVSLELKGDHQGAMGALGTGSHPVQDRLAHSAQNAGWQKHGKIWDSPDDPQKHPGEFNQALKDTQSYIDEFLLRTGRQGCVCSQSGAGN
ncbi:MAG: RHS repeat-associated core domain-containing protein, partial [Nitrospirota bacterium]